MKTQPSECYEIPGLVDDRELKPERFLLRRGRKARKAYEEYMASPQRSRDVKPVLSATMKDVSLLVNNIRPSSTWKFATSNDEISVLPIYYGSDIIDVEFEKRGFTLWHPQDAKSVADRIIAKKSGVDFTDFVNVFNPHILMHDLLTYRYESKMKKLLPEKGMRGYVQDFMTYLTDLYGEIREPDQKTLKSNLETLVKTYFMPEEMRAIIHNSHPYDNREASLVNPDNMMFGPRVIDVGSVLGWPEIHLNLTPEIIRLVINGFYLKKRENFYEKDANFPIRKIDPILFEYGSYLGGIYTALREVRNFNTNVKVTDEAVKLQLKFLCGKSKEARFVYDTLSKYQPRIRVPSEEYKGKGDEWQR